MARTMTVDNTGIYRALVSRKLPSGKVARTAYGPYDSKAHAQDRGQSWDSSPSRVEKQVLVATDYMTLKWITFDTKYTNGGKDVNWDAE